MQIWCVELAREAGQDVISDGIHIPMPHGASLRLGASGRGLEVVEIPVLDLPEPSSPLLRASLLEAQGRVALVPERACDPGALVVLTPEAPWNLCSQSVGVRELARGYAAEPGLGCRMGKRRVPVLLFCLLPGTFLEGKSWGVTSARVRRLSFNGCALAIEEQFTPQNAGEGGES